MIEEYTVRLFASLLCVWLVCQPYAANQERAENIAVTEKAIKEGSQVIELRSVIRVVVTDVSVRIQGSKAELSYSKALDFFEKMNQRYPNSFDLFVQTESKSGGPEAFLDRLIEQNAEWKINLLIRRMMLSGHTTFSDTPMSDQFEYFSREGKWPSEPFHPNSRTGIPRGKND